MHGRFCNLCAVTSSYMQHLCVCAVVSDVASVTQYWGLQSKTALVVPYFKLIVCFLPTDACSDAHVI